jgi:hypothetical protein
MVVIIMIMILEWLYYREILCVINQVATYTIFLIIQAITSNTSWNYWVFPDYIENDY